MFEYLIIVFGKVFYISILPVLVFGYRRAEAWFERVTFRTTPTLRKGEVLKRF